MESPIGFTASREIKRNGEQVGRNITLPLWQNRELIEKQI